LRKDGGKKRPGRDRKKVVMRGAGDDESHAAERATKLGAKGGSIAGLEGRETIRGLKGGEPEGTKMASK